MAPKRARRSSSNLEDGDNPKRSVPLSFDLRCSDELQPLIRLLTTLAIAQAASPLRPSSQGKLGEAFDLLLANLLNAYRRHPQAFVGVSLNRGTFTVSRYRKRVIGFDNF